MFRKLVAHGGSAVYSWDRYDGRTWHGVAGETGTIRKSGGGGSGGNHCEYKSSWSGRGGYGTSYSGGSGGGASSRHWQDNPELSGKQGSDIGGPGGAPDYTYWARIWGRKSRS